MKEEKSRAAMQAPCLTYVEYKNTRFSSGPAFTSRESFGRFAKKMTSSEIVFSKDLRSKHDGDSGLLTLLCGLCCSAQPSGHLLTEVICSRVNFELVKQKLVTRA